MAGAPPPPRSEGESQLLLILISTPVSLLVASWYLSSNGPGFSNDSQCQAGIFQHFGTFVFLLQ